jgi:hypothetical protein
LSEKASKLLAGITTADLMTKQVVEMVEAIFHIEDLYQLSKGNSFLALNFFQLITNIDYIILTPGEMRPAGASDTAGELLALIGVKGQVFPFTIQGKIAAIAECFKIQADKMDKMVSVEQLTAFMQGTGAAQIAQDAINSFTKGGMAILQDLTKGASQALPLVAGA